MNISFDYFKFRSIAYSKHMGTQVGGLWTHFLHVIAGEPRTCASSDNFPACGCSMLPRNYMLRASADDSGMHAV
jgi:hypothetical protein